MPNDINPNDPYAGDNEILRQRAQRFDNELQADPELAEGPATGSRIALFAIAIVAILGVVFYGLSSPTTQTTPTAQTTTTPAPNSDTAATRPPAGQTTGSSMTPSSPSQSSNPNATSTDNGVQFSPPPSAPNSGSTSGTAPAMTAPANN